MKQKLKLGLLVIIVAFNFMIGAETSNSTQNNNDFSGEKSKKIYEVKIVGKFLKKILICKLNLKNYPSIHLTFYSFYSNKCFW